jgi:hypothetical protein
VIDFLLKYMDDPADRGYLVANPNVTGEGIP